MKKSTNTKKILLVIISACIFLILSIGLYVFIARAQGYWPYQVTSTETPTIQSDESKTVEPTYSGEKTKNDTNTPTPKPTPTNENGKKIVNIIASPSLFNESVEVRAAVSGVVEDGGVCTAIFSKNGVNLSYTSSAFTNTSSSQCELIKVAVSDFTTKGTWQLKVSYSSKSSEGESSVVEVDI